jgi:hypothetical protein
VSLADTTTAVIPEFRASEISGTQVPRTDTELAAPGSRLSRFALGRDDTALELLTEGVR